MSWACISLEKVTSCLTKGTITKGLRITGTITPGLKTTGVMQRGESTTSRIVFEFLITDRLYLDLRQRDSKLQVRGYEARE